MTFCYLYPWHCAASKRGFVYYYIDILCGQCRRREEEKIVKQNGCHKGKQRIPLARKPVKMGQPSKLPLLSSPHSTSPPLSPFSLCVCVLPCSYAYIAGARHRARGNAPPTKQKNKLWIWIHVDRTHNVSNNANKIFRTAVSFARHY